MQSARGGQRVRGRHGEDEPVVEQTHGLELGRVERQGQHEHVEGAALQLVDDHGGLALAQPQVQRRVALLQARQRRRQQVGGDRRDHAQAQRAGEQPGAVPGIVHEVVDLGQDARGPARDLLALGGERDPAAAALDQRGRQTGLELLDLDRQRRLADRAFLGRAAEMAMARQSGEIAQLAQRGHNFILSARSDKSIRTYPQSGYVPHRSSHGPTSDGLRERTMGKAPALTTTAGRRSRTTRTRSRPARAGRCCCRTGSWRTGRD